ncbi:MAG: proline--tRNA ligase [Anaerolineae bacterium]
MADKLPNRREDFAEWYNQVVLRGDLADYGPARGSMILKPYGYAFWENIQAYLDRRFKQHGAKNAFFPTFIPLSYIEREAHHVEGFAPNLWLVTIGGGQELEEKYVVRPTSETTVNEAIRRWVHSYRDLPVLLNLWNSAFRYELRTRLFLRTSEFLWQEGHTSHATFAEADQFALSILHNAYNDFYENAAAVSAVIGKKSEAEKFPGAHTTYTIEAMMGDTRALQACTSHNLGDNFARAFGIQYLDRSNTLQYVWQTSWGFSTRSVGGIIMVHGDDKGLVMPPRLAPTQLVIVPIFRKEEEQARVMEAAERIKKDLDSFRVELDAREGLSPGYKFNDWELHGVPIRVEIGPKDIDQNRVVLVRRDTGEKKLVPFGELLPAAQQMLDHIHDTLLVRSKQFREANTHRVDTYDEFKQRTAGEGGAGFLMAHWCGNPACEKTIQTETRATIRCIPFDAPQEKGVCIYDGAESERRVVFAKAY